MTSYAGHVAIVTGAARGIGRELARQLARPTLVHRLVAAGRTRIPFA